MTLGSHFFLCAIVSLASASAWIISSTTTTTFGRVCVSGFHPGLQQQQQRRQHDGRAPQRQFHSFIHATQGHSNDSNGGILVETNLTLQQPRGVPRECWEWIQRRVRVQQHSNIQQHEFWNTSSFWLKPLSQHKGANLGFCNSLYIVCPLENATTTPKLILKVYSDLAQSRIQVSGNPVGAIDALLAQLQLGPRVYESNHKALLMEWLEHATSLTEDMIHANNATTLLVHVAQSLARLHTLQIPNHDESTIASYKPCGYNNNNNMLWDSIHVLLPGISDRATRTYLQEQVHYQKKRLDALKLPMVNIGHGDFKPSNIMLLPQQQQQQVVPRDGTSGTTITGDGSNNIRLIDLETAGCHYRAYDLAKLFRTTSSRPHSNNQEFFLQTYLETIAEQDPTVGAMSKNVELLQLESDLLLPMTWLEAAIFFHASQQPLEKWKEMATLRLENYVQSLESFEATITNYQQARQEQQMSQ